MFHFTYNNQCLTVHLAIPYCVKSLHFFFTLHLIMRLLFIIQLFFRLLVWKYISVSRYVWQGNNNNGEQNKTQPFDLAGLISNILPTLKLP